MLLELGRYCGPQFTSWCGAWPLDNTHPTRRNDLASNTNIHKQCSCCKTEHHYILSNFYDLNVPSRLLWPPTWLPWSMVRSTTIYIYNNSYATPALTATSSTATSKHIPCPSYQPKMRSPFIHAPPNLFTCSPHSLPLYIWPLWSPPFLPLCFVCTHIMWHKWFSTNTVWYHTIHYRTK